jgi:hypothetical protein
MALILNTASSDPHVFSKTDYIEDDQKRIYILAAMEWCRIPYEKIKKTTFLNQYYSRPDHVYRCSVPVLDAARSYVASDGFGGTMSFYEYLQKMFGKRGPCTR